MKIFTSNRGLLIWLVLLLTTPTFAQIPPADSTVVADTSQVDVDSVTVEDDEILYDEEGTIDPRDTVMVAAPDDRSPQTARYPADSALNSYRADRDYQYGDDIPPPESLIGKFFTWLFRKIGAFFNSPSYQSFWRYVILIVIAGLVVYLGVKAEYLGFLVPGRSARSTLDYETLKEDIHAIDFERELETATTQGNFRLAVRLLYLRSLKQLTDRNLIDWKPDKTNGQYVYELGNQPFSGQFNTLTRDFDYVWYGDFPLDKPRYEVLQTQFSQFAEAIRS